MTLERIVNRVSPTTGYQIETERLNQLDAAAEAAAESEGMAGVIVTADADRAPQVGRIEFPPEFEAEKFNPQPGLDTDDGLRDQMKKVPELQPVIDSVIDKAQSADDEQVVDWSGQNGHIRVDENGYIIVRDPDLIKFREQVVAAFKHLGLDTRKFFGV